LSTELPLNLRSSVELWGEEGEGGGGFYLPPAFSRRAPALRKKRKKEGNFTIFLFFNDLVPWHTNQYRGEREGGRKGSRNRAWPSSASLMEGCSRKRKGGKKGGEKNSCCGLFLFLSARWPAASNRRRGEKEGRGGNGVLALALILREMLERRRRKDRARAFLIHPE